MKSPLTTISLVPQIFYIMSTSCLDIGLTYGCCGDGKDSFLLTKPQQVVYSKNNYKMVLRGVTNSSGFL